MVVWGFPIESRTLPGPIKRKPPTGGFFASGRNKIIGSESELCPHLVRSGRSMTSLGSLVLGCRY